eukprot:11909283-Alexandrium_andersonii.AAC.1
MEAGWRLLRKGLSIEPEQRIDASGTTYLEGQVEKTPARLSGGRMATIVAYSVEELINSCVVCYSELSGNLRAREFAAPFVPE